MKKNLPLFIVLAGISAYTCETRAEIRSPYMTKVLEFRPAPGQFINELPEYEEGDTEEKQKIIWLMMRVEWFPWEASVDIS